MYRDKGNFERECGLKKRMGNLGLLSKSVFLLEKEIDRLNSGLGLTGCQIGSDRAQFFSHSPKKVKTQKPKNTSQQ